MKVHELRIGNFVKHTIESNNHVDRELIIDDFIVIYNFTQSEEEIPYKPIILTEEILLKCGFENNGDCDDIEYLQLEVIKMMILHSDSSDDFNICVLHDYRGKVNEYKYLHQIQNLYHALTGKELEVKS